MYVPQPNFNYISHGLLTPNQLSLVAGNYNIISVCGGGAPSRFVLVLISLSHRPVCENRAESQGQNGAPQ